MNAIVNDTRLAAILSDNAPGAHVTPESESVRLDAMEASAVAMGMALGQAESAASMAAKDWGCQYLNLTMIHNYQGDSLAERTRAALGWKDLKGEAGSVIKRRFNTWRSNVGYVAGKWPSLSEETKTLLLGGGTSFITVYKNIKAEEAAAAAKAKAEKMAAEKAAETAPDAATPAPSETVVSETVEMDASELILALTVMLDGMDADAIAAIQGDFAAMVNAYDAKVNSILDAKAA